MFGKKSKKKENQFHNTVSTIAAGTFIEGTLRCEGTLVVQGDFYGTVEGCEKMVIGESGSVEGEVSVKNALVYGKVNGSLEVNHLLHIQASGSVEGQIKTGQICIDVGGQFSGSCEMGAEKSSSKEKSEKPIKQVSRPIDRKPEKVLVGSKAS